MIGRRGHGGLSGELAATLVLGGVMDAAGFDVA
jgi:hypothetical protein